MLTTKRFTPAVLERFERQERGKHHFSKYRGWHQVTRGDPGSRGRSHITFLLENIEHDQLSDLEQAGLFFSIMSEPFEVRMQFPLHLQTHEHELNTYDGAKLPGAFPGTLECAAQLGFKAPECHGDGATSDWIMSTDILLTFERPDSSRYLLAICMKYANELAKVRNVELLQIEREYWRSQGVEWLLVTPNQYDHRVFGTLQRSSGWGIRLTLKPEQLSSATATVLENLGESYTDILRILEQKYRASPARSQEMFWQSIWHGHLRYDLRTGWRPHLPVLVVTDSAFRAFNPILSRRSEWNG